MKEKAERFISSVSDKKHSFLKNAFQTFFFLLGLGLLIWTIRHVGLNQLLGTFSNLRFPGAAVLLFYPFVSFWDAWGWLYSFAPADQSKVCVRDLFWVRLAGEAMNNLTPLADWGGEPLKIRLLVKCYGIDKASASTSVFLTKSILFFSETLFWVVGLIPALFILNLPEDWKPIFVIVFIVCVILSFALALIQMKGLSKFMGRLFPNMKSGILKDIDAGMAGFYSEPIRRFLPCFALHLVGWFVGGLETYLMLYVLGVPAGLGACFALEALFQVTRTATFFIPGSLGVQEAGMAVFFSAFGLPQHQGVALSLVKRARQLLWSAVGLGVWGFYEKFFRRKV